MSLTWNNENRVAQPSVVDLAINRACTVILIFAALYLAGHIVAAWLRGSFEHIVHKSLEAIR